MCFRGKGKGVQDVRFPRCVKPPGIIGRIQRKVFMKFHFLLLHSMLSREGGGEIARGGGSHKEGGEVAQGGEGRSQWSQRVVDEDIKHNSVNFQARSPKFCMEVDLDLPPEPMHPPQLPFPPKPPLSPKNPLFLIFNF